LSDREAEVLDTINLVLNTLAGIALVATVVVLGYRHLKD
jgi:hypothetical protein